MAEATLCKVSSRQRSRVAGRSEFEALMRANQGRIVRLAAAMLHDRDAAEDVAQETFIRAFRFGENFRNEAAFSTWIYRIALNLCLDARRKARRSDSIDDVDDDAPDLPDPAPGPEALFSAREWARHTDEALDKLSSAHRAILLLREVEGLSYEQIAIVLEIPKGTVMSRLHHARLKVQRAYRDIVEHEPRN